MHWLRVWLMVCSVFYVILNNINFFAKKKKCQQLDHRRHHRQQPQTQLALHK